MNTRTRSVSCLVTTLVVVSALTLLACKFDSVGLQPMGECGDGVMDPGEDCDTDDLGGASCGSLGYGTGTLACDSNCGFVVSGCDNPPVCGDSTVDIGEECDDGNTTAGDGCDPLCQIETPQGCGNGTVDAGEECDDSNTTPCDGCSAACTTEVCGNGTTDCNEGCDDGNTTAGDGCDALCQIEIPASCGDGTVDDGEECDDSNNTPCDGCSAACTTEVCGNGTTDCNEDCDDGGTTPCDGCSATCTTEGCGNGTVECTETCEAGQVSSDCAAEGFAGGTLGCNGTCDGYDVSQCFRFDDGQACTAANQCVGNICFTEADGFPEGFCTSNCIDDGDCVDGVCRDINGTSYCYRTCTTTANCRPGYYCRIDGWEWNDLVCRPLCTSNADCPITGVCNRYVGRCANPGNGTGANGAACTWNSDCLGACLGGGPPVPSGNYCVSECNRSSPNCPGDGVCSSIYGAGVGDLGYCLDGCQSGGDCTRPGFSCVSNPFGQDNICWQ